MSPSQVLADNLRRVRDEIAEAAVAAGREPKSVALVAVAKYVGPELTALLYEAGCKDLGESRPQQLWEKAEHERLAGAQWHLIGHLQRNKARRTVPLTTLIHSIDSPRILRAVDEAAAERPAPVPVLLEVNCSGDAEKHGVKEAEVGELMRLALELPHVEPRGLMTMSARGVGEAGAGRDFAKLRSIGERLREEGVPREAVSELSMGMSGDFHAAIAEGATLVRIGSALWEGVADR